MNQDWGSRLTFFSTTDTTSEIKTAKMSIQKKESQDQSSNQLIMQMDENFKETKNHNNPGIIIFKLDGTKFCLFLRKEGALVV